MKVAAQKSHVEVSDDVQTKEFGIVFDRHMVNILSNQLYRDKILAVVRELSTNAIDSQIEAGYDGQFDVHLPTWHNPEFWVRDYGTGMSPEKIDSVYRNYGKSDRQDSDNFTGCMGLGSKTPFCYYTKSFKVDSWYEGIHYQYACFLNEDGMPQIALMTHEPSDEPSGVKVSLPTSKSDERRFLVNAQEVYQFFSQNPNLVSHDPYIDQLEYSLSGDNWKFCDKLNEDGMKIIMGNVAYPVSAQPLEDLNEQQRHVVNSGFHVFANIGDVAVTASREGLDYTNRTKTHIRQYINNIIKSFTEQIQKQVDQCKNLWEARIFVSKNFQYSRKCDGICDLTQVTYNGHVLFDHNGLVNLAQFYKNQQIEVNYFRYSSYSKIERQYTRNINPKKDPMFYVNDLRIGGFVRSTAEVQKFKRNLYLITFKDESIRKEFLDYLGIDDSYLTDISSIPSPTTRSTRKSKSKTTPVMIFNKDAAYRNTVSYYWKNAQVDVDDGGKYVEFNRFNFGWGGSSPCKRPQVLYKAIECLDTIGIDSKSVYAIKTARIKKFRGHSEWEDFYEWAVMQIKAKIKGRDLVSPLIYKDEVKHIGGYERSSSFSRRLTINELRAISKYCNKNTKFYQFVQKVLYFNRLAKEANEIYDLRGACNFFGISVPGYTRTERLKKEEESIYNKYKLLNNVRSVDDDEHIALYINAVDGITN